MGVFLSYDSGQTWEELERPINLENLKGTKWMLATQGESLTLEQLTVLNNSEDKEKKEET